MRDRQPELLGGFEIDDQLEGGRLLNRQVGGLRTFEDPSGVNAELAKGRNDAGPIADQAAESGEFTRCIDRRNGMARGQSTICSRQLVKNGSLLTTSPSACSWRRVAKAASISFSVAAFRIGSCSPLARAASCTSRVMRAVSAAVGTAILVEISIERLYLPP
jgi:hypothetical protein